MSIVSLTGENGDRYSGVKSALSRWAAFEAVEPLFHGETVLVKPNCVSATQQAATTHRDALRAVLEFIDSYRPKELIIGEGSAADTIGALRNFGYVKPAEEYGARIVDLNRDSYKEFSIYSKTGEKMRVRVAETALKSVRVSLALPKTHDTVIMTAALKNMVMGSILKPDKIKMHQGYPAINLNIALLGKVLRPHLGVIDGLTGMEGDGPIAGRQVLHRIAIAGTDAVALDAVTSYLMGFSPREIGYLVHAHSLGLGEIDLDRIEVLGPSLSSLRRRYTPHRTYTAQREWSLAGTPLALIHARHKQA